MARKRKVRAVPGVRRARKKVGVVLKAADWQIGTTTKHIDAKRRALKPGKRRSRSGRIYFEHRKNRSDLDRWL